MWQRFTERARKVVFYAQEEAVARGKTDVASEHLLLGLLRDVMAENTAWPPAPTDRINLQEIAAVILQASACDLNQLRSATQNQISLLNLPSGKAIEKISLTPSAKKVIDLMYEESRRMEVGSMTPEFLLLGLIRDEKGAAGRLLAQFGLEIETARRQVAAIYHPVKQDRVVKPPFWSRLVARRQAARRGEDNTP